MAFRNSSIFNSPELIGNPNFSHDTNSSSSPYHSDFMKKLKVNLMERRKKQGILKSNYDFYIENYLETYKDLIKKEYMAVKQEFPNVHFDMEMRVKSRNSYENKIVRKLAEGRKGNLYDIFANKITIYSIEERVGNVIKMNTDEDSLISKTYEIYHFLAQTSNSVVRENRDYISKPKPSGYKSLHLLKTVTQNSKNFNTETQIKTFRMHECEEYGTSSHRNYKNRASLLQSSSNIKDCVPIFFEVQEHPKKGVSIYQLPFYLNFERFFGISFKDYQKKQSYTR